MAIYFFNFLNDLKQSREPEGSSVFLLLFLLFKASITKINVTMITHYNRKVPLVLSQSLLTLGRFSRNCDYLLLFF